MTAQEHLKAEHRARAGQVINQGFCCQLEICDRARVATGEFDIEQADVQNATEASFVCIHAQIPVEHILDN